MILVRNLRLGLSESPDALRQKAAGKLKTGAARITGMRLVKRSLDARKKNDIHYVCSVAVEVTGDESAAIKKAAPADVSRYSDAAEEYAGSIPHAGVSREEDRPLIVGFGPAGMFAALVLAKAGLRPVVIERGEQVEKRAVSVGRLRSDGVLNPESNAQFGEGGAGTFSDGKLNTGTHDSRIAYVLRVFHEHGAAESVMYDSKPHIGTDVLVDIVRNMREDILSMGGEIRFETRLDRLVISGGRISGAEISSPSGPSRIGCSRIILATGHSARDTFSMLKDLSVPMERKAFSMGARIEHLQGDIDLAQYGDGCDRGRLPAADYSLSVHFDDGASAYTFCMCPGGEVFAAASEEGGVCTNGMSLSSRSGANANSALLVTLLPEDFPGSGVLAGVEWQREIERRAFSHAGGGYLAPAQTVRDFLLGRPSSGPGRIIPTYRPGVAWGDIHDVLPKKITAVLERAIPELGRKLAGFDDPDAVLTAPECRSSSPVRILRGKDFQSGIKGLYPCGEGAGYAGGITSAAVDGLRCAEAVIADITRQNNALLLEPLTCL